MHTVSLNKLKPGMKLGKAIKNADDHVLFAAGTIITKYLIHRLAELAIPTVDVELGLIQDTGIDDLISEQIKCRAISFTRHIFNDFQYHDSMKQINNVEHTVNKIIDELLDNKSILVNLMDIRCADEYTFTHSVNTCVLALITAINLNYSAPQLSQLAKAAILHDIGKIMIPQEIINKPGKLTEEEIIMIMKHVKYGYEIIKECTSVQDISAQAVLYHHERYNGSGYPLGLKGPQIPRYSTIIGIADMYDALTIDRVYRHAHPLHEVYATIAASSNCLFDDQIVQSFLHYMVAYPVGSLVQLSTNEVGIVVENRPGLATQPKTRILFDPDGKMVQGLMELDLSSFSTINITRTITGIGKLSRVVSDDSRKF